VGFGLRSDRLEDLDSRSRQLPCARYSRTRGCLVALESFLSCLSTLVVAVGVTCSSFSSSTMMMMSTSNMFLPEDVNVPNASPSSSRKASYFILQISAAV
jgi:hypothetical protein